MTDMNTGLHSHSPMASGKSWSKSHVASQALAGVLHRAALRDTPPRSCKFFPAQSQRAGTYRSPETLTPQESRLGMVLLHDPTPTQALGFPPLLSAWPPSFNMQCD